MCNIIKLEGVFNYCIINYLIIGGYIIYLYNLQTMCTKAEWGDNAIIFFTINYSYMILLEIKYLIRIHMYI